MEEWLIPAGLSETNYRNLFVPDEMGNYMIPGGLWSTLLPCNHGAALPGHLKQSHIG